MNIFRFIGDMMHLVSLLILTLKLHRKRGARGISLKTLVLYAVVFLARYVDLFITFVSIYNTFMKISFITLTLYLIYLVRVKFRSTYEAEFDNCQSLYLVLGAVVCTFFAVRNTNFVHMLWVFSLCLEPVAIFPQLWMLQNTKNVDNITADYIFSLGAYRFFYILNWIYRYYVDDWSTNLFYYLAGIIQTGIYLDFFYYYFQSKYLGQKLSLPK